MKGFNAAVGGFVNFIVSFVLIILLRAWVLTQIWGWLVVPLFHLQPLRLVSAYTIMLLTGFLVNVPTIHPDPNEKRSIGQVLIQSTIWTIVIAFCFLLFGWIAHFFV